MNRASRRMLDKKGQPIAHVCQDGAHVLYSIGNGYLLTTGLFGLKFVVSEPAEYQAQRFHQECAGVYAAQLKAQFGLDFEVRHEAQAGAGGWK